METSLEARVLPVAATDADGRIGRLGLVLIGLGLASLLPELLGWLDRLRGVLAYGMPPLAGWPSALGASQPNVLAWRAWPLAVGFLVWARRWPTLLVGASATFALLGLDELGSVAIAWLDRPGPPGARPDARLVASGLARVVLATLALGASGRAWSLRRAWRRAGGFDRAEASRPPAIVGRLVVVGALVFGVMIGAATLWTLYERFALRSPGLRNWVNAVGNPGGPDDNRLEDPRTQRLIQAASAFDEGAFLARQGQHAQARRAYIRALNRYEALAADDPKGRGFRRGRSLALNNLSWLLATSEDASFRDPDEAVALARRGLELTPEDGNLWNTLGVALVRAREFDEADAAFARSQELRDGGDAFDWFFMASMAEARGDHEGALALFERAQLWREQRMPYDPELLRFHAEAAEALRLDPPAPPPPIPSAEARRPIRSATPLRGMMED